LDGWSLPGDVVGLHSNFHIEHWNVHQTSHDGDVVDASVDHATGGFMTLSEVSIVISIAVGLSGIVTGALLYFDKRQLTKQAGLQGDGNFILTANQAIALANKRAFDAEKERDEAEKEHQRELIALKEELKDLKNQFNVIMERMRYVVTFDVVLDPKNPIVEHVEIKHIADMRKEKRVEK
jgi:hypothetical protein